MTMETTAVQTLRNRLGKTAPEDHMLEKWLKARSWDVDRAEAMFKASMKFRDAYQVLEKYLPGGFIGTDRDGSPVLVDLFPQLDAKGLLQSVKKSDIEKAKLLQGEQILALLKKQSDALNKRIDGITVIIDMAGATTSMLWGPGLQMYAHMGKVLQDNYPEVVKRTFIVNAPSILPLLWKAIKPLVTEEMRRKVSILGSEYQAELLAQIDADQLPKYLGGSKVDCNGDPRCAALICQGGIVPEKFYSKESWSTKRNMKRTTINQGSYYEVSAHVELPGSILRWEFLTDSFDLGFGINYKTKPLSEGEILVPTSRVNSHMVPQDGVYKCSTPGIYVIRFDNTYSWARSKSIHYNIDLLPPVDEGIAQELNDITVNASLTSSEGTEI